eukprot:TRINITY_DN112360_c0_g1_i1.p1 TRINITY_DN112360_c0_g1~~TRINITY_DN112360_c0_g1_i1.p1  ORF type:complete len:191 (-),score=29.24 TRINITY_DN112360_c0_g1_i1:586-1158(-)
MTSSLGIGRDHEDAATHGGHPGDGNADMRLGLAPSTESVACWVAYEIYFRNELCLVEPGRLFYAEPPRGVDARIQEMLQPIFSHISREDHAERTAFLHIARALLRRSGWDHSDDLSGWIKMYVSHFPCISCVAVSAQFLRFFPAIRLQMDFDNMWKARYEPPDKAGADAFLENGGISATRLPPERGPSGQ